jgi:hypothetical protein
MSVHHFACLWASRRGAGGSKQGVSDHMTTGREQAGRDASTAWDRRDLVPGSGADLDLDWIWIWIRHIFFLIFVLLFYITSSHG